MAKNDPKIDKSRLKRKDDALLELLAGFHSVFVHIDARRDGVIVPPHLKNKYGHHLVLQLGLNLPVPIRELKVEQKGFSGVFSFDRVPSRVFVPWTAVYIIAAGEGENAIAVQDIKAMPDEFLDAMRKQQQAAAPPSAAETKRKTLPPFLRVIDGGKSEKPTIVKPLEPGPHKPAS